MSNGRNLMLALLQQQRFLVLHLWQTMGTVLISFQSEMIRHPDW
jgi:hypothetical protein